MNEKILNEVSHKLDRLLAILDPGKPEDEALYMHCVREAARGNRKPMDVFLRRGGKIPHVEAPTKVTRGKSGSRNSQ